MFQPIIFIILFIECLCLNPQSSLKAWLNNRLLTNPDPTYYVIRIENDEIIPSNYKSKRSIQDVKTETFPMANTKFTSDNFTRHKRTIDGNSTSNRFRRNDPKINDLKANLRYHHQQRHTNGSVTGSYGQLDPKGLMKVMHYVSDDKGFREYQEGSEPQVQTVRSNYVQVTTPSNDRNVNIVTNSNNGFQPVNNNQQYISQITPIDNNNNPQNTGHSNRRDINPYESPNLNFVTDVPPYNFPSNGGQSINFPPVGGPQLNLPAGVPSPIFQSATGSVNQFSPKSPLFDKYHRPSPDEVQRTYEYHRMRSNMDPKSFRPPEASAFPDIPRDKQPELRSTYSEYQIPYTANDYPGAPGPPYAPLDLQQPTQSFQDPLSRQPYYVEPYPQTLQPQAPVFLQSYDGQAFVPGSTYNGPGPGPGPGPGSYVSNTATFNQPYPTNIPIYSSAIPQNLPTYSQPLPQNIPIYSQMPLANYGQNVYYTSASDPQPKVTTKS